MEIIKESGNLAKALGVDVDKLRGFFLLK